jgi:ABC-type multidrug transport system fused ATPase/permease subunit
MVRSVIENQFGNHTVISIAHRLETIIDYDKVVVLDQGKVVEVGNPKQLLREASRFKALWNASHHETA